MFITTRITWDLSGKVIEHEGYFYSGPISSLCGASSQQNQIEAQQQAYYQTLTQQAQQEFGQASKVFDDLYAAMSPIVAAGINQQGFSTGELQNLNSIAETSSGEAYSAAAQNVREQEAAAGGSNFVPSGANEQINAEVAARGAGQTAGELNQIEQANYATGRSNYLAAAGDLSAATGTYSTSIGAANAATAGGNAAANTANQIAQENNSWVGAVTGALGGIAGSVVSGGMSNLGKGVGFFGQNG